MKNKTKVQVQAYGGAAGKDLDSCYHRACDTISNTSADLLKEMSASADRPGTLCVGPDPGLLDWDVLPCKYS